MAQTVGQDFRMGKEVELNHDHPEEFASREADRDYSHAIDDDGSLCQGQSFKNHEDESNNDDDTSSTCSLPPEDYFCPITQEILLDPVQDLFGHTYERSAILEWLSTKGTCPMTRKPMRASDLIPNVLMKTKVRLWLREHNQQPQKRSNGNQKRWFCRLYDSEDSSDDSDRLDDDDDDEGGSNSNNILFGYWSHPIDRNDITNAPWDSSHASRRTTDANPRLVVGEVENGEESYEARIDRLLEEYNVIVQEEEHRQRRVQRRQRRREGRQQTLAHHVGQQPGNSQPLQPRNSAVGSQITSESSSPNSELGRRPGKSLRNLLFSKRTHNLQVAQ